MDNLCPCFIQAPYDDEGETDWSQQNQEAGILIELNSMYEK